MFPPFETELALHYGRVLAKKIDSGEYRLIPKTKPSMERLNQGVMLGVLVCTDEKGRRVYLAAPSGIHWELESCTSKNDSPKPLFVLVPPVVSPEKIADALSKNDEEIHRLTREIADLKSDCGAGEKGNFCSTAGSGGTAGFGNELQSLKEKRTKLTTESLNLVHCLYKFHDIKGNVFTLNEIIKEKGVLPPTGIGDCCEIKLLDFVFTKGWKVESLAQVYYEKGKVPSFVEPCDSRCSWLLPRMLGLNILYQDKHLCVINKPSGLLSVPGRSEENKDCAESRLSTLYPGVITQSAVHRLDMETSGILVLAKTEEAHRNLRLQFENQTIEKKYTALLSGILEKSTGASSPKHGEKTGETTLPFRLDPENRPHQIYDEKDGKFGTTQWKNLGVETWQKPDGTKIKCTRMEYTPKTGRTHQLRLLSADKQGFNLPIIGDSLYGTCLPGEKLQLKAFYIKFRHPISGVEMEFSLDF